MAVAFSLYDRWDTPITRLKVLSARHTEELNGEDTLTIEAFYDLNKGQRIVWQDHLGAYHEHVVDSIVKTHAEGKPVTKAVCVNSIVELWNDYIDDRRLGRSTPATASSMLSAALEPTRWTLGPNVISATGTVTFYHTSAREAIQAVQEVVGGELVTTVTANAAGITRRQVSIVERRGNANNPKRFSYTKDVNVIERTVESEECVSQLYVYGKGVEMDSGGYGRRLTIESVNSGKKYLEDSTAKQQWGRPDGKGGIAHSTGVVVFDDVDDPSTLKKLGQAEFAKMKTPRLSYSLDVVDLASMGFTYEGVGIGDSVSIIDHEFDPAIRAYGRVTRIDRDLLDQSATVTIGNVTEKISDMLRKQAAELAKLRRRGASWQLMSESDLAYLEQLRSALNDAFEANSNYKYESFERGTIYSNVPCDEDTFNPKQPLPTGVSPWAMQLSSAGFRIASSINANGTWKWTTFGTGEGFTADALVAGTIQSAAYRATGKGDHWILGQNGHLEAYDAKMYNGTFTNCDSTNLKAKNATFTDCSAVRLKANSSTFTDCSATNLSASSSTFTDSTAENMTATNLSATGQFTTESGNYKTRVTGGVLEIYYGGELVGTVSGDIYGTAKTISIKRKNGGEVSVGNVGSYMTSKDGTEELAVTNDGVSSTHNGYAGIGVNKTVRFYDGSSTIREFVFTNGLCTSAS